MEHNDKLSNLTSGEIAYLWNAYQSNTMIKCLTTFFLYHAEDEQTKELLAEMKKISTHISEKVTYFLEQENYPIPVGLTEKDVNMNAPRLFSDVLYLEMLLQLTKVSLPNYQLAYIESNTVELQQFFRKNTMDLMDFEAKVKSVAVEKGIFIPTPRIPTPSQIAFVKKDSFLAGWFGEKRPLLGIEIAHLVFNAKRNGVGHAFITGFSQVAQSKEVRKYFERGRDIARKQIEVFSNILLDDNLPSSSLIWTSEVSDSKIAPFTDKLMMQMITVLIASGMSSYGTAMSMSARKDLGVHYTRLLAEIALYANDGAEILIKNGWMEQPPIAVDRKDLAK